MARAVPDGPTRANGVARPATLKRYIVNQNIPDTDHVHTLLRDFCEGVLYLNRRKKELPADQYNALKDKFVSRVVNPFDQACATLSDAERGQVLKARRAFFLYGSKDRPARFEKAPLTRQEIKEKQYREHQIVGQFETPKA